MEEPRQFHYRNLSSPDWIVLVLVISLLSLFFLPWISEGYYEGPIFLLDPPDSSEGLADMCRLVSVILVIAVVIGISGIILAVNRRKRAANFLYFLSGFFTLSAFIIAAYGFPGFVGARTTINLAEADPESRDYSMGAGIVIAFLVGVVLSGIGLRTQRREVKTSLYSILFVLAFFILYMLLATQVRG